MTSTERREQQRQDTRDRILLAARELLLADGVDGFSMRKLAGKVGYTATAIYSHFADKDAVLQAVIDADCVAIRKAFDGCAGVADPVERVRAIGRAYIDFGLANPNHFRLMVALHDAGRVMDPANVRRGDPAQDGYAFLRQAVASGIAAGRYRPEFADPDELAQVFMAVAHGVVALHLSFGHDPWFDWRPVRRRAEHVLDVTLRGLVRGPADRPT